MNERLLNSIFWLDECMCGLKPSKTKYCRCKMTNKTYNPNGYTNAEDIYKAINRERKKRKK